MLATVQYVAKVTFTLRLTLTCWALSFIAPATTLLKTPYYSHTDNTHHYKLCFRELSTVGTQTGLPRQLWGPQWGPVERVQKSRQYPGGSRAGVGLIPDHAEK